MAWLCIAVPAIPAFGKAGALAQLASQSHRTGSAKANPRLGRAKGLLRSPAILNSTCVLQNACGLDEAQGEEKYPNELC